MKHLLPACVIAAIIAASSGTAFAQERGEHGGREGRDGHHFNFRKADLDGDGSVSLDEMISRATEKAGRVFEKMDRNGDGLINRGDRGHDLKPDGDRKTPRGHKPQSGEGPDGRGDRKPGGRVE